MAEENIKNKKTSAAAGSEAVKNRAHSSGERSVRTGTAGSAAAKESADKSGASVQDGADKAKRVKSAEQISRNRYRKMVSYAFSFVLSLFMMLITICLVALTSLFSENFFYGIINDDYYEAVLSDVITEAEDYTIPAEFDISVLDNVFTLTDVKRDVNGHVTAAFRGYNFTPNLETENSQLYANVAAYIAKSNIKMEDDEDTVIAAYVQEIDKIYLQRVRIPGINLIKVAREKVKGVVTIALILLFAVSMVLGVVLLKLYRHPHKGLRYVAYASGGCTLMAFVVPFMLYLSKVYAHVQVTPEYFYHFVSNYLKQIIVSFMEASLIWLLITMACGVYIYLSKNGKLSGKLEKRIRKKLMTSRR